MSADVRETLNLVLTAAWNVLWVGVVLGAGLPTMFALGVRSMAGTSATDEAGNVTTTRGSSFGKALAAVCFLVCLYGVVTGLMVIVGAGQGKIVTFENLLPILVPKP
ncbi:MAG: hypothetical protein WAW88_05210 [Nocardioides sp.]